MEIEEGHALFQLLLRLDGSLLDLLHLGALGIDGLLGSIAIPFSLCMLLVELQCQGFCGFGLGHLGTLLLLEGADTFLQSVHLCQQLGTLLLEDADPLLGTVWNTAFPSRRTGGYYCPFDFFLTRDSTSLTRPQLGKNGTNPILTVESTNALASLAGHV